MLRIEMYSSATKVKGQGVGSAYSELLRLLTTRLTKELSIGVNTWKKADVSHYHTVDFKFYLSTFLPHRGTTVGYVHFIPETLEGSLKLPWLAKVVFYRYLVAFYKRMDRLVVVNPTFIDKLVELGIDRTKVTYIPNFVSRETFFKIDRPKEQLQAELGLKQAPFTVVGVGQIQARKGLFDFIELAKRMPHIQFVWVGGFSFGKITDGYKELKAVVDHPPKNLLFPGIVSREQMNAYYNAADLFLLPSYNELFPMSVLEAFSSGLPVMLRDLDLYHSIIEGDYYPTKDVDEMEKGIVRLSTDARQLAHWVDQSHKAAAYYSEDRLAKVWLDYYRSVSGGVTHEND